MTRGKSHGEDLSGLAVVAAIDSEGTLTTNVEGKIRSVVFVDDRASEAARSALLEVAKSLAPRYLKDIVEVRPAKISYSSEGRSVTVAVGNDVRLETTALSSHCDSVCGNEAGFYPPRIRPRGGVREGGRELLQRIEPRPALERSQQAKRHDRALRVLRASRPSP